MSGYPQTPQHFDAVIVGGGPRAVATVIRTVARLREESRGRALHIAIVDALEVGPGATWLTTQPAEYLNNTTASATTIYPDESTPMSGPPSPGPTLVDWMEQVAASGNHPAGEWVAEEAGRLRALDFTSRRLQGIYYRDQLDAAVADPTVHVTEVTALAVDLEEPVRSPADADAPAPAGHSASSQSGRSTTSGRSQATSVMLADGRRLRAPTVVLAQGMVQSEPDAEVTALAGFASRHGLRYVSPGMPAERDYSALPAGEPVLVRGLGANFFDVIGGLAAEWGGRFEPVNGDPHGRLRYAPSGREPRLVAGSRRGVPYRSKPEPYTPERPYSPRWATREWFAALEERTGLDFATEVWPTLAREIADQYLAALAEWEPEALAGGSRPSESRPAPWLRQLEDCATAEDVERLLTTSVTDLRWRWTLSQLRRPTGGRSVGSKVWQRYVSVLIEDELASMSRAAVHPRAAVNRVMSVLRGPAQRLGAVGAVSGESLVRDLHGWFDADGLFLASGPPSARVRQVLALMEAGIIELLGPETVVHADEESGRFRGRSLITGRSAEAEVLLETRMSKGRVTTTDDPLLQALLGAGRARIHAVDGSMTDYIEASGAYISEHAHTGHNLVDSAGDSDPAVVVLGIPASTTQPGSAIGATPHKPSPLLAGADVAAKQIVRRAAS